MILPRYESSADLPPPEQADRTRVPGHPPHVRVATVSPSDPPLSKPNPHIVDVRGQHDERRCSHCAARTAGERRQRRRPWQSPPEAAFASRGGGVGWGLLVVG